ncbi:MAG: DUF3619 family protein [Gammaproteobacteria bacterium]|nr:DUF3619 family protein [Gammaproteobacteria bacterium]
MNANDERDFAQKITAILDGGLPHIEDSALVKLRDARAAAMTVYRAPVRVLGLITVSGRIFEPAYLIRQPLFWLPILVIVATLVMTFVNQDDLYDESGAVDALLLTSELPIDAFLDNDFATWVKEKESTPER